MRKFFISSHGRLASGIKTSLEILMGQADNVTVFDAYIDKTTVESQVEAWLETLEEGDQAIMLSDLYGGSVNQVLYRYLDRPNTYLVAGINLGLVLELVAMSEMEINAEELDRIIASSREAMVRVELDESEVEQDEFF